MKNNIESVAPIALRGSRWGTQRVAALVAALSLATACAAVGEDGELSPAEPEELGQSEQAVTVTGACSNADRNALVITHGWLIDYTVDAYNRFLAAPTSQRAQRWFGTQEPWMRNEASTTLYTMTDIMAHAPVQYLCEDGVGDECQLHPGWGAYVSTKSRPEVHICPAFWSYGNQERLTMLAHEFAHFRHSGHVNLRDYFPDFEPAEPNNPVHVATIALFPELAVRNASNYAYYIMNLAQDPE